MAGAGQTPFPRLATVYQAIPCYSIITSEYRESNPNLCFIRTALRTTLLYSIGAESRCQVIMLTSAVILYAFSCVRHFLKSHPELTLQHFVKTLPIQPVTQAGQKRCCECFCHLLRTPQGSRTLTPIKELRSKRSVSTIPPKVRVPMLFCFPSAGRALQHLGKYCQYQKNNCYCNYYCPNGH